MSLRARLLSGYWAGTVAPVQQLAQPTQVVPAPLLPPPAQQWVPCPSLLPLHAMEPIQLETPAERLSLFIVSFPAARDHQLSKDCRPQGLLAPAPPAHVHLAGASVPPSAPSPGAAHVPPGLQKTGLQSTWAFLCEKMPITF